MFRRLFRSLMVLGVLLAAYQAYVTFAVPLMEPPLEMRERREVTRGELDRANEAVSKYQLLLSNYFPKDHWSQTRQPKVIANSTEQMMLVFDDFKRRPGGSQNADGSTTALVDIEQIAILIFPTPPREGITPPRDAVLLEAPRGAHLEFDDFRPEVGKIGQIIHGEFPGMIRIRSDMRQPGPEDDLLIETSDLQMNTKLMYSAAPVRFRMGQSIGGGTELEIRFLADEHMKPSDPGLKIAGIDSLEIRRDVKMRLQMDASSLLPNGKRKPANAQGAHDKDSTPYAVNPSVQVTDASAAKPAAPKPPLEVSCSGPFTFDFVRYVASLDRDVDLRQINANGPSDQLACARLDIHFAPKLQAKAAAQPPVFDQGKRQQRDLGQLEPVAIVAEGHPVSGDVALARRASSGRSHSDCAPRPTTADQRRQRRDARLRHERAASADHRLPAPDARGRDGGRPLRGERSWDTALCDRPHEARASARSPVADLGSTWSREGSAGARARGPAENRICRNWFAHCRSDSVVLTRVGRQGERRDLDRRQAGRR